LFDLLKFRYSFELLFFWSDKDNILRVGLHRDKKKPCQMAGLFFVFYVKIPFNFS